MSEVEVVDKGSKKANWPDWPVWSQLMPYLMQINQTKSPKPWSLTDEPEMMDESKQFNLWNNRTNPDEQLINRIGDLLRSELQRWDSTKKNQSDSIAIESNLCKNQTEPMTLKSLPTPSISSIASSTTPISSLSSLLSTSTLKPTVPSTLTSTVSPPFLLKHAQTVDPKLSQSMSIKRKPILTPARVSYIPEHLYSIRNDSGIRTVDSRPLKANLEALRQFAHAFSASNPFRKN